MTPQCPSPGLVPLTLARLPIAHVGLSVTPGGRSRGGGGYVSGGRRVRRSRRVVAFFERGSFRHGFAHGVGDYAHVCRRAPLRPRRSVAAPNFPPFVRQMRRLFQQHLLAHPDAMVE